jgi:3-hydroxymyristoyl/3-hydroxydecanoyl-(acyl carrier protein) dehydratase
MYADGKMVVEMTNMSIRLTGANRDQILALWKDRGSKDVPKKPAIYDRDKILAVAEGKVSDCFGEPFKIFDDGRFIARLPRPPYSFLDRITEVNAELCDLSAGGNVEGQYDIPEDEWYFESNRTDYMPFAVLLEVALQVCGWYSSYMGSSLTSDGELHYRNLGGSAILYEPIMRDAGMLTTRIKSTKVASSAGMIIQNFDMEVLCGGKTVYKGDTYFGFFSPEALADQVGVRDAEIYEPTEAEISRGKQADYPTDAPFQDEKLRMIERIDLYVPDGGPKGLGFIRGSMDVDPSTWFFKAHFYQDPVIPGSLGLESMLQLLKYAAFERWGDGDMVTVAPGIKHEWIYRGQVIPSNKKVVVDAWITSVDDENRVMTADGFLSRDGLVIYEMRNFSLKMEDGK